MGRSDGTVGFTASLGPLGVRSADGRVLARDGEFHVREGAPVVLPGGDVVGRVWERLPDPDRLVVRGVLRVHPGLLDDVRRRRLLPALDLGEDVRVTYEGGTDDDGLTAVFDGGTVAAVTLIEVTALDTWITLDG